MEDWLIALISAVIGATASGLVQYRLGSIMRSDKEAGEMTASCRVLTREFSEALNVASLTRTEASWVGGRAETRAWNEHRGVLARALSASQWLVIAGCAEAIDDFERIRTNPKRSDIPDAGARFAAGVVESRADAAMSIMAPYCRDRATLQGVNGVELIRRSQRVR